MQDEFTFDVDGPGSGLARWRAEQKAWQVQFAKNNGLPLGHACRVVLKNDMEMVGQLRTADEELPLDASRKPDLLLRIDRCTFKASEIASVARLD
jgi:hypothetical protein